ncbi:MAG: AraC family transcriptional regulator [Pseudomonadota bacterium]
MHARLTHKTEIAPACLPGVDLIGVSSERVFPRHSHGQFGIGLMRSGGHRSWSAGGTVEATPGNVLAVSPDELHDGSPLGAFRAWDMIYIEPLVVQRMLGREVAAREFHFAARSWRQLASSLRRAFAALAATDARAAEEYLTLALGQALRERPSGGDRKPSLLSRRVITRIHDLPASPPTLDEVAALMGMGRTGSLRRFQREVGATPNAYAMQYRLRLARRALSDGEEPGAVAAALGFADQSHLTRCFSRQYGLPPGRYRAARANIVQDSSGPAAL